MYRRATEGALSYFEGSPFEAEEYTDVSKSYAAFGELTRLLLDGRLEVTAGFRHFHDDISQTEEIGGSGSPVIPPGTPVSAAASLAEANTPRGVVTWHVSDRIMTYASDSQGFRSGFPQDAAVPDFPPARPDRLTNYEIGSKGTLFDGRVAYDASVYYMDWKDIHRNILFSQVENIGYVQAVVNGAGASGIRTDLAVSYRVTDDFILKGAISWNDLEMDGPGSSNGGVLFQKGDRPIASPETTGYLSADYHFPIGSQG